MALLIAQVPPPDDGPDAQQGVRLDLEVSVEAAGVTLRIAEEERRGSTAPKSGVGDLSTVLEDGHQVWVGATGGIPSDRILWRAVRSLVQTASSERGTARPHVRIWLQGSEGVPWTEVQEVGAALEYGLEFHGTRPPAASVQLAASTKPRSIR